MRHIKTGLFLLAAGFFLIGTGGTALGQRRAVEHRMEIQVTNQTINVGEQLTIRIDGVQPNDMINLAPKEQTTAQVAAGIMVPAPGRVTTLGIGSTAPLPDGALSVTPSEVRITRAANWTGNMFVHVDVPMQTQVTLVINDQPLLNARLSAPIAFWREAFHPGFSIAPETFVRATLPNIDREERIRPEEEAYRVPPSKVQVLKRVLPSSDTAREILVAFRVDAQGRVFAAHVLTQDAQAAAYAEKFKEWVFAPYVVDGKPVPFLTVMKVSF